MFVSVIVVADPSLTGGNLSLCLERRQPLSSLTVKHLALVQKFVTLPQAQVQQQGLLQQWPELPQKLPQRQLLLLQPQRLWCLQPVPQEAQPELGWLLHCATQSHMSSVVNLK